MRILVFCFVTCVGCSFAGFSDAEESNAAVKEEHDLWNREALLTSTAEVEVPLKFPSDVAATPLIVNTQSPAKFAMCLVSTMPAAYTRVTLWDSLLTSWNNSGDREKRESFPGVEDSIWQAFVAELRSEYSNLYLLQTKCSQDPTVITGLPQQQLNDAPMYEYGLQFVVALLNQGFAHPTVLNYMEPSGVTLHVNHVSYALRSKYGVIVIKDWIAEDEVNFKLHLVNTNAYLCDQFPVEPNFQSYVAGSFTKMKYFQNLEVAYTTDCLRKTPMFEREKTFAEKESNGRWWNDYHDGVKDAFGTTDMAATHTLRIEEDNASVTFQRIPKADWLLQEKVKEALLTLADRAIEGNSNPVEISLEHEGQVLDMQIFRQALIAKANALAAPAKTRCASNLGEKISYEVVGNTHDMKLWWTADYRFSDAELSALTNYFNTHSLDY